MNKDSLSLEEFLEMPDAEVANVVRDNGSKIVVFPINGTRRWFMLEYGDQDFDDQISAYMDIAMRRHIELYKIFFDHGVETLLTPVIGPEIIETRDAYMQKIGAEGLARFATHPEFLSFYDEFEVKVRFYGEYRKYLADTGYEHLIALFDQITEKTKNHGKYRLFFGAFADQMLASETVAEFAVHYFIQHQKAPARKDIIEMYYGEYLEKAHIFIGFDRFAAFDYPLLNWGEEDLYFTVSPSLYMTKKQVREILFDHLFTRRMDEVSYEELSTGNLKSIHTFYKDASNTILGLGKILEGTWVPKL